MDMSPQDWLDVVRREYLEEFVRDGGAAVKFVVPGSETDRVALRDGLRGAADTLGFQFAFVSASETKIHLIDRLFHEVARQVDWDGLVLSFLSHTLAAEGHRLPSGSDEFRLPVIAELNGFDERLFRQEVNRSLWNRLFRDYAMSQEFRLAMIQLCRAQLDPGDDPALANAVREWLRGELRLVSAVKGAIIFQRIARHNARHMLFSLAHWLKIAGKSGLVLGMDISRYADSTRPSARGDGLYYSTAAALDAYEVLRQLIDATDELEFCLFAALAGPEFLSDDRRGLRSYHALNLRIADEVRDRYRQNPLSSLVRIAPST